MQPVAKVQIYNRSQSQTLAVDSYNYSTSSCDQNGFFYLSTGSFADVLRAGFGSR